MVVKPVVITDYDFIKFKELFYKKTGIKFDVSKRYFVDKRLVERIEAYGCSSFREYYNLLRSSEGTKEFQELINVMTVNESYFFREEYQFKCLVKSALPEIVSRKKDTKPIRFWIIPSAAGEEPYSIAIYLLEKWDGIDKWDVELISSDIDTKVLDQAKRGLYSKRAVQYVPEKYLRKYFTRTAAGYYQICDDLGQSIRFTRVNLCDPNETRPYRDFDIIFCRNLLIYFDDVSRRLAAETFYDALKPGGFIFLGHSESMSRISSLYRIRKFSEAIIYQKPLEEL